MCSIIQWLRSCHSKKKRHRSSNWTRRNEKESKVLWGSLYNMTREKLLVLHKTLTELWISSSYKSVTHLLQCLFYLYKSQKMNFSSVWTTVTWTESPEESLPLLLIYETLQNIEWAQWYIKLNVIVAFHKIWIAAEDKWKTAFHMRYRLYEWMMTSFELVNVLSTFQRYINWALQNFLNEFCSAYVNDIHFHWWIAASTPKSCTKDTTTASRSLQIDIDKCEFEVKSTKYLKFILKERAYKWILKRWRQLWTDNLNQ
jgi:hypothetical protein